MKHNTTPQFIFFLLLIALYLAACSPVSKLDRARKTYDIGEYYRAIPTLNKVYRSEKNQYYKGEASFYMAESYRHINQPRKAASAYGRAVRYNYNKNEAKLQQARQLLKLEEYEDALKLFDEYLKEAPGRQLAYNGQTSAKLGLNPPTLTRYQVEPIKKLSSKNSDYAPYLDPTDPSQIYFSSMRMAGKKRKKLNRITGQGSSAIYTSILNSRGEWQDPELFLNQNMDGSFEDGTFSMTSDGKTVYFTRTRYEKSQPMAAEIWMTQSMGGRWSEPVEVEMGPDSVVFAHPALTPDGNTMYFVSDMKGSIGGKDIWKVDKHGDSWGTPVNLGTEINTEGDELFPYIRENGVLYFSSDGLPGFGGLDIFIAEPQDDGRWKVSNMGRPINSSADDLGITFYKNREAGFISSSRGNAKGYESIYSFNLPQIQPLASGTVRLSGNEALPRNAVVKIVGTDGTNTKINIDPSGSFSMLLKPDTEYSLLVSVPGYLNHSERISTLGIKESKQYSLDITLTSVGAPMILSALQFDTGSAAIKSEAEKELSQIIDILNNNPDLKIEISAHTEASGNQDTDLQLSKQRADAVYQYLTDKGIDGNRLSSRGAGSSEPLKVDAQTASKHAFLRENDVLTEQFIQRLNRADQRNAVKLNNRVEFTIIR